MVVSFQIFGLKELFQTYSETSRAQLGHQLAKPLALLVVPLHRSLCDLIIPDLIQVTVVKDPAEFEKNYPLYAAVNRCAKGK